MAMGGLSQVWPSARNVAAPIVTRNAIPGPVAEAPWYDHPQAEELLDARAKAGWYTESQHDMLRHWVRDGYLVVDNVISDADVDGMLADLDAIWTAEKPIAGLSIADVKLDDSGPVECPHEKVLQVPLEQRLHARETTHWRVHGFYRFSPRARKIFDNPKLLKLAELIMGTPAEQRYTINFVYGSQQRLHQDTAVFAIVPANYLVGAWLACEDIVPGCGPLVVYPGSHREPMYPDFAVDYPQTGLRTCNEATTDAYHNWLDQVASRYPRIPFHAKKGQILLWHGMTIHGGEFVTHPHLTRKSYVCHYAARGSDQIHKLRGPFNW